MCVLILVLNIGLSSESCTKIYLFFPKNVPHGFFFCIFAINNNSTTADGTLPTATIYEDMEEYLVSARKYRPATFDTVVGQRALTTTLLNAIRLGKLAHAYLFCGPRGVGKTTCARIFAKTINCMNPGSNMEACNECESCRAFDEGRSMNIHELDAASNNSVEDMRELIKQVQIPPQIGRYKVFIIDEVHMLSTAAFNAFLKTLEEPPSYAIFILATTEKHKILPTILSRCQVYDFQRMSIQSTVDHLRYVAEKEGVTAEDDALNLIAQKADGGMRDALSIFDQMVSFCGGSITYQQALNNLNMLDSEYYFRLVDHFLKHEVEPCMLLLNEIINHGFDAGIFIGGLASHLRDVLVARDEETLQLLEVSESMKERYKEQAKRCEPRFIYRALRLCNECDQAYRTSRNKRLQVEICLIECAQEDDILGRGRRPKTLRPLFKVPAAQLGGQQTVASANTRPATTPQSATTTQPAPTTAKTAQEVQAQGASSIMQGATGTTPAGSQPAQTTQGATTSGPTISLRSNAPLRTITLQSIPSLKRPFVSPHDQVAQQSATKGLEVSFQPTEESKPQTVSSTATQDEKPQETQQTTAAEPALQFNENNILQCWNEYATRIPREHMAMSQRMRAIQPKQEGDKTFSVTVNSPLAKKDMEVYVPYIVHYFETRMGTTGIQMVINVADIQVVQKAFTKPEVYRRMTQHNSSLAKLSELLGLELE